MTQVVFACVHNAGRSQMAAALLTLLADPTKVRGVSAGTQPGARVHPEVLLAMRELGVDLEGVQPQLLTAAMVAASGFLITMGCGEACPVAPPSVQRLDWPLEDPKGKTMERVREIRDEVRQRVEALIAAQGWSPGNLPV
jgi:arsenate reductase